MSSSAVSLADLRRKSSKPQGPEYEYFEIISKRGEGKGGYRVQCKFCRGTEMNSHAPRMRKHLVSKCQGPVPDEVRNKFKNHKPIYTRSEGAPPRKRPRRPGEETDSEEEDEDDDSSSRYRGENESAVHMLHQYMVNNDVSKGSKSKGTDETTHGKKSVRALTDVDFDREQKELLTKKMRLEVKIMEDQRKFWSCLSGSVDKIIHAVDLFIDRANREGSGDTHTIPVHTNVLYANQDGVLHTAYSETINPSNILSNVVNASTQEDD